MPAPVDGHFAEGIPQSSLTYSPDGRPQDPSLSHRTRVDSPHTRPARSTGQTSPIASTAQLTKTAAKETDVRKRSRADSIDVNRPSSR